MEDPDTMNIIRGVYVLSNVIIISVYAYVHFLINKKKGMQIHTLSFDPPANPSTQI